MTEKRRAATIAVIGDARVPTDDQRYLIAEELGRGIIDHGYRLLTGGMGGVMEAACRGARSSTSWREGDIIGVLPGSDPDVANPFVDIVVTTGLDHGRNQVVAQSAAVVAVGGGAGSLSELAFAWIYRRLVIALRCSGWSGRLADQRIDERARYPEIEEDCVYGADDAKEALKLLERYLPLYHGRHRAIS